jgi:hypothetical protein
MGLVTFVGVLQICTDAMIKFFVLDVALRRPESGSCAVIGGTSTPWTLQGIDLQSSHPLVRRSAKRVTPAGSTAITRSSGCMPNTWGWPPWRGSSRAVARRSTGISPGPSRPRGNGHGIAGSPWSRRSPWICDGGGTRAVATPNSSGGSSWPRGTSRRDGRGSGTSADGGGRRVAGSNCDKWPQHPSRRRSRTRAVLPH